MKLTRISPLTGKANTLDLAITQKEYDEWKGNPFLLIQNAFPHLSDDEREFILTGYAPGSLKKPFQRKKKENLHTTTQPFNHYL